jgi:hypothetical protein
VRRIAGERNHARVRELADEPRLAAWLRAAGISLKEAAAIQPSYCSRPVDCICTDDVPYPAVVEGTVIGDVDVSTTRVTVDAIHGSTALYRVGDEALLVGITGAPSGSKVVVPISPWIETGQYRSAQAYPSGTVAWDGSYHCFQEDYPSLNQEQYVTALRSSDWRGYLKSLSPAWTQRSCQGGEGCASSVATGDAPPSTLGILLALCAVMLQRRVRS